jgi:hypothetical protein
MSARSSVSSNYYNTDNSLDAYFENIKSKATKAPLHKKILYFLKNRQTIDSYIAEKEKEIESIKASLDSNLNLQKGKGKSKKKSQKKKH